MDILHAEDTFTRDLLLHVAARAREQLDERDSALANKIIGELSKALKTK